MGSLIAVLVSTFFLSNPVASHTSVETGSLDLREVSYRGLSSEPTFLVLEASGIRSTEQLHSELRRLFGFPSYYGGNWDALFDLLMSLSTPTQLTLKGFDSLQANIGGHDFAVFVEILLEVADQNPNFSFVTSGAVAPSFSRSLSR